ncbi:MAG: pyridoxal 5'-phosphate synthase glutaminase subunit PdxT [Chloroflexi bacterium]|nr:MAG: glutamine amidotransferase subunit PdxT [Chloroflexi bacterium OLB13]MBC6954716.1 pyridoxal 5'-phosphate synthase glutaminase subunit PdxT [Chloroflexota bacterium]MBV6436334.1 Pyridoxal 5'-phosphate synthase subunit PdxT [Anaerolineae bacterium]OQY83301.1 MAG: pyridoxal 5'-phosphate synthase glutaminase subunit PdxT [Anaerolineae bacterium UTCFX5]MBW7878365.1 pyridoxal 5'-phosphate synthase glutaminase subunit PdxT [Anaerolineae bacterium]
MEIGVLALQGAFIEHRKKLESLGATVREVRLPEHLDGLDGLIIPGGESTTIGKLAVSYGLLDPLREFTRSKPTWGTCAGMIFLAKDIGGDRQPLLGVMDLTVNRNAFGRQIDSFEVNLDIAGIEGGPFPAIFIRAPVATSAGAGVDVLARLDDQSIVAARQGHLLATAFHPELSDDARIHRFFLDLAASVSTP